MTDHSPAQPGDISMTSIVYLRRLIIPAAILVAAAVALVVPQTYGYAQRTRFAKAAGRTVHKRQEQAKVQPGMYAFGDVTLHNYVTIKGNTDQVRATGPKVLVDSVDPKANSTTHMTAREFIATMGQGGVDKLE